MTEMQQFALDFLKKEAKWVNAGYLATMWAEYKGRHVPAASRNRFGITTAAYKTLRKLAEMERIDCVTSRSSSGYLFEEFKSKAAC